MVKNILSQNRTQEGSVLYITLVILIALGFLCNSFHQSQKQFSNFYFQVKFDSKKEAILKSTKRLIQGKIKRNPTWQTESYIHNFTENHEIKFTVSPWGLAKKISIKSVQIHNQADTSHLPTWYLYNKIPIEEIPTLVLLDSNSSVTLGGNSKFDGSISANQPKLDLSARYEVRYTNKMRSNATHKPWKKYKPNDLHESIFNQINSMPISSTNLLIDSNNRYRDTLLSARKVKVSSLARFKNTIIIADTISIIGRFDYLNAQFIAKKKLFVNAIPSDSIDHIEGHPYFVLASNDTIPDTSHFINWSGSANIYHLTNTFQVEESVLKIDSNVQGQGILHSEVPLQLVGTWTGSIICPILVFESNETLWKNLLYNGSINSFSEYSEIDSISSPGNLYE